MERLLVYTGMYTFGGKSVISYILSESYSIRICRCADRTERRTSRLSELERKAKPYLKQAQDAVPAVASDLATFRSMSRFCRLLAQDKLLGTQTAQEFLAEKLRPVTSPCRRIAGLYGATPLPGLLQRNIRDIAEGHAYASLCAAGGGFRAGGGSPGS